MEYPFTINKRLFSELFARHRDTFVAFCELLNNALQAEAKEIRITLTRSPADRLSETLYESITIRDNGVGVSKTEFRWKILEIATDAKEGGKGIGRFAALQLGAAMRIETVAFDLVEKCFYQTAVTINSTGWDELKTLDKIRLDVEHNKLEEQKPYYEVKITNFYGDTVTRRDTHKRVHKDLTPENIEAALFARYADTIVRKATKFIVNDKLIDPANYVIGDVESIAEEFMALDGSTHPIRYQFMLVKSTEGNHRIFLRVENSGIQTVAQTFNYDVDIPEDNRWFVFVDSPYFDSNSDPFRNLVLSEGLDPNATHLLDTIKSYVDTFLAKRYEHYRTFLEQLKADEFYPYKEKKSSSQTRAAVFNQLAYHVETEHRLLNAKNKVRRLVYNLIDRSLSSRDFEGLLADTIKLDDQIIARFRTLLERVDLDDVITFSDEVASKMQFLDFLHTLVDCSEAFMDVRRELQWHSDFVFGQETGKQYRGVAGEVLQLRTGREGWQPGRCNRGIANNHRSVFLQRKDSR